MEKEESEIERIAHSFRWVFLGNILFWIGIAILVGWVIGRL